MGQLNSNDIPPNPFVHGWNEPDLPPPPQSRRTVAREVPSAARTPLPSQQTHVVSPLRRAHEMVSQPLPPARRPQSPSWPIGFVFAAIAIVASLILFAAVPHGQYAHLQTPANTNQVAANSKYSGSLATASTAIPPSAPVNIVNSDTTQRDPEPVEVAQPSIQTQLSNSSSSETTPQTPVPAQEQPPQNDIPAPPVQSTPVLPAVIASASIAQTDSKPAEAVQPPIQSQTPYSTPPTPAPQSPVLIQAQLPQNVAPVLPVQRRNSSTDNQNGSYSKINVAPSSHSSKPGIHIFRTVGRVISWPVVHVFRTVGVVLPTQQPTRYIYIPAPAPNINGYQNGRIVYPQQQYTQINPGRVYYYQHPVAPVTTYQPGYQQRVYYSSQFVPQIRYAPNYPTYRPPNMGGMPPQQRRMR